MEELWFSTPGRASSSLAEGANFVAWHRQLPKGNQRWESNNSSPVLSAESKGQFMQAEAHNNSTSRINLSSFAGKVIIWVTLG